tara:strand:+ start:534 stop:806 length:273 start_codon:yes stop_codon:yes gene_type:complete
MSGLFGSSKPKTNDAAEQRLVNQERQAEGDNRDEQKKIQASKIARTKRGKQSLMSLQGNPFGDNRRSQLSNQLGAGRKSFSNNTTYGPQN